MVACGSSEVPDNWDPRLCFSNLCSTFSVIRIPGAALFGVPLVPFVRGWVAKIINLVFILEKILIGLNFKIHIRIGFKDIFRLKFISNF